MSFIRRLGNLGMGLVKGFGRDADTAALDADLARDQARVDRARGAVAPPPPDMVRAELDRLRAGELERGRSVGRAVPAAPSADEPDVDGPTDAFGSAPKRTL